MASPKIKDDYHVGIITALPIERAAITAMLDERHSAPADFIQHPQDSNSYTWGSIATYGVVVASLSTGVYGTTSATTTVLPMIYAFPNIKWGLMVGIGAGVPSYERDIRLGDVAVSQPIGSSGGVFQYDLGNLIGDGEWKRLDWLARPPDVLLKALGNLQAEHEFKGSSRAQQHLLDALKRHPEWAKSFASPPIETDRLFESSYSHPTYTKSCVSCDPSKLVHRRLREKSTFHIHYGSIASGNSLIKHAELRERILQMEDQCICIEMEAAGLMNNFPCLVIRGICDYADTHKNDLWQRYASTTAAAFAKELLTFTSEVGSTIGNPNFHVSGLSLKKISQADKNALKIQNEASVSEDTTSAGNSASAKSWRSTTSLLVISSQDHKAVTSQKDNKIRRFNATIGSASSDSLEDIIAESRHLGQHQGVSLALIKKPSLTDRSNIRYETAREDTAESSPKEQGQSAKQASRMKRMQETDKTTYPSLKPGIDREQTKNLSSAMSYRTSSSSGATSTWSSDGGVSLCGTGYIDKDQDKSTKQVNISGASTGDVYFPPSHKYQIKAKRY